MKRIILCFSCCLSTAMLFAQTPEDALRLSWNVQSGTARAQAIGGAMGSLGGDITSTFVNPAGLGFYRTGDVVFTPSYSFGKTRADYLGRRTDSATNKFAIGTSGVVWGGNDHGKTRSSAISLAINQTGDFKTDVLYRGQNNSSSYSQKFLEEIRNGNIKDGNSVASNFPFGTSLAFNTYWIDTVGGGTNGNFQFQSRAPISTGLLQQNTITSRGGVTEFALGVGVNLNDKVLVGGTLGVPVMRLERETEFVEADATNNATNKFDYAIYKQGLTTTGVGVNLKGGIIYKPQEFWRIGFAFHSPTVYSLTDKNTAEITTNTEGYKGTQTQRLEDVTGAPSQISYLHLTPLKLIGSVAYVLREIQDVTKQRGFLTADVEYVSYPMMSYYATDTESQPADPETKAYFKSLNKTISDTYKGAFNLRAGGELKFTTLMVRAGVAYYGNPYKNIHDEKGNRLNLSGGLGYRNKGFFIDATYVYSLNNDVDIAYRLQSAAYYNASLKNTAGKIFLTLGVKI
ncbi:OmpP1/FadL family transporter [Flavisolibacter ginsenosidimutans]|uniref:Aromatic hydrocarbon degradation protein n=1 Tax=Flavisolibacter ginsenosidimutans TaxID=661481 RepID=A0A5B8UFG6_9BACT|nr:aromatic hydrocarbon degradation protein [Flavisolibacter ginsenosidimutans]QEC55213.1 aromatic hydrocarbon degradation protein [Flavisolibacter ginsenosidimutans]